MLKNIAVSVLMFPPLLSHAMDSAGLAGAQLMNQAIQEQGLPPPDGGIILKPISELPHYEMLKESIESDNASIKKHGYIKRSSPEVQSLLNFKKGNKKFSPKNLTASADTGLYRSINDLQMAYRYYGVPASVMTNDLAVAPAGTYLQGQGWTGAAQTFESAGVGTCNYSETNAKLSHGSVFVPQETATYEVNGKVTQKFVKGEEREGFMYGVSWYDTTIYHDLECVQTVFSADSMKAVVKLAIAIDNNAH